MIKEITPRTKRVAYTVLEKDPSRSPLCGRLGMLSNVYSARSPTVCAMLLFLISNNRILVSWATCAFENKSWYGYV